MKKVFNFILIIIIIGGILYLCDLYSGYKISLGVDKVLTTEESTAGTTQHTSENNRDLNNYLYYNMSEDEKEIYDTIYHAITGFKTPVFVGYFDDAEEVFDIFKAVMSEHPELFWCTSKCSLGTGGFLNIDYIYSKSEAMEKKQLIEQKADEIIAGITGDEYTRALACYDYVILNTRYDIENVDRVLDVPADSTIEGVFLNNTAVCAGYAKAYQYLLHRTGLSAMYVTGIGSDNSSTENHAWLAQQIDGKYYYSDPTWDDTKHDNVSCHSYFCLTAGEISVSHELDDLFPLLTANSVEANYFVRENRYFDKYALNDVRRLVAESLDNDCNSVEFRYKTSEEYEKAKERLFEMSEIYLAFKASDYLKYSINVEKMTLILNDVNRSVMIIYNIDK